MPHRILCVHAAEAVGGRCRGAARPAARGGGGCQHYGGGPGRRRLAGVARRFTLCPGPAAGRMHIFMVFPAQISWQTLQLRILACTGSARFMQWCAACDRCCYRAAATR